MVAKAQVSSFSGSVFCSQLIPSCPPFDHHHYLQFSVISIVYAMDVS